MRISMTARDSVSPCSARKGQWVHGSACQGRARLSHWLSPAVKQYPPTKVKYYNKSIWNLYFLNNNTPNNLLKMTIFTLISILRNVMWYKFTIADLTNGMSQFSQKTNWHKEIYSFWKPFGSRHFELLLILRKTLSMNDVGHYFPAIK